jgi:hypothetical protein
MNLVDNGVLVPQRIGRAARPNHAESLSSRKMCAGT